MPDSKATRAIQYLKSLQPKVNKVARFAWTPTAEAVTGVKAPEDPKAVAQDEQEQDLQRQIDAYKYIQEQARIKALREKLTAGN
jgi:cell division protein FtsN